MKLTLSCLILVAYCEFAAAATPTASAADKLYPEFDQDLSGCGFSSVGLGQTVQAITPPELRGEILADVLDRALSLKDPRALENIFSYFAIFHGDTAAWNDRLEKNFMKLAENPDVKYRLGVARALTGFPEKPALKFAQLLAQDSSSDVRDAAARAQRELAYEKSLPKAH